MKKYWCILWITILGLGFTVGMATAVGAKSGRLPGPFLCRLEIASSDEASGRMAVDIGVTWDTRWAIDTALNHVILVRVDQIDDLQWLGIQEWAVTVERGEPLVWQRMELTVPTDDTCGFWLVTSCGDRSERWPWYFITAGDSLQVVTGDPRTNPGAADPIPDSILHRLQYEEQQRYLEQMRRTPPPPPEGIGATSYIIYPGDSALADSLTDEDKGKLSLMRAKESTPLSDSEQESYAVEGRWFFRLRGESRFRPLSGFTREELHERYRQRTDSLAAADTSHYNVILDLRAPGALESAREIVDSLVPTDSAGFYRTSVKRMIFRELLNQGIPCQHLRDPNKPKRTLQGRKTGT